MRVLVSGATGLIGGALKARLEARGDEVVTLTRRPERVEGPAVGWDLEAKRLDEGALDGIEAVIHLAGESIAAERWTAAHKSRVLKSRVQSTVLLAEAIAKATPKPKVFVSASAIGFYGSRGAERLDEEAEVGEGFLADVCLAWETAAQPARNAGVRVVHPRIGIVLSETGGALEKMVLPFRMGMGGKIGSGAQYMPWISLRDVVGILMLGLDDEKIEGPLNATAPEPATNLEFTRALGQALARPTLVPLPGFAAKLALGSEMADQLLLSSTRAVPSKALAHGYAFEDADLLETLKHVTG